jgi:hypothetical protein
MPNHLLQEGMQGGFTSGKVYYPLKIFPNEEINNPPKFRGA